ncbi:VOC family protein [Nakamurella leprariae]|uniref:VOC family protein n=1 Tax=Nakamurella leprariae TaxID=2803911 RepID=A0A938YAL1_9ACTN|nr:VOC family protein [Nakamurella leprariae]MBM9469006.1 VOC family protein [Nakamurella leprariae]
MSPSFRLSATVLDTPDVATLTDFYRRLLGWETIEEAPEWARLRSPDGGAGLSFQLEPAYRPPTWPAGTGELPMMAHLDIEVDDLDAAGDRAAELGATLAGFQPQQHVRVWLDPAGHPFCLFLPGA